MMDTKQSMTAYFIGGCKKGSKPKCAHIPGTFLKHKLICITDEQGEWVHTCQGVVV